VTPCGKSTEVCQPPKEVFKLRRQRMRAIGIAMDHPETERRTMTLPPAGEKAQDEGERKTKIVIRDSQSA
jgi:hypothetical protein